MRRHIELVSIRHVPTPSLANCPPQVLLRARVLLELESICYDNYDDVIWSPNGLIERRPPTGELRTRHGTEAAVMASEFAPRIHEKAREIIAAGESIGLDDSTKLLAQIAAEVAALDYSGLITVFGSMARLAERPGDLDVCVDLSEIQFEDSKQLNRFGGLLAIARQHYGLVDPFIKFRNTLIVRNDDATGWVRAKNARTIGVQIYTTGRPLADVTALYPC